MSRELKASLALANINVHEFTTRRSLNNSEELQGGSQLVYKRNVCLQFAREHVDKPGYWMNVL